MQISAGKEDSLLREGAEALRHGRDPEAEEAALNRLLELEPYSVNGNVMKGDCRAPGGDENFLTGRAIPLASVH